jgi:hypothetical protein
VTEQHQGLSVAGYRPQDALAGVLALLPDVDPDTRAGRHFDRAVIALRRAFDPPTGTEIAWAAGLFEGEGTFSFFDGRAKASMSLTDLDVLVRFRNIVGVGSIAANTMRNPRHKPQWQWWAYADEFLLVHDLFRPWLCSRRAAKSGEVRAALNEQRERLQGERACSCCSAVFRPRKSRSASKARYCSEVCLRTAKNVRRRERHALNRAVFQPGRVTLPEGEERARIPAKGESNA